VAGKRLQKTKVCFPRNPAPGPEEVEPAGEFFSKTDRNAKQRFQWIQIKECLIQPDITLGQVFSALIKRKRLTRAIATTRSNRSASPSSAEERTGIKFQCSRMVKGAVSCR